jgi:HlyD family secretion protein
MRHALTDRRVLAFALLVGGLLTVALWSRPVAVDLVRVSRGPLVVTIDEEARTRVRDRFLVTAPVTGHVLRIDFEPGDRVSRGDVVARLRSASPGFLNDRAYAEARAAVRSAEAALGHAHADEARTRAVLEHIERRLRRTRQLSDARATTMEELEAREADAALARYEMNAAAFAVHAASAALERARLRAARFDGDHGGRIVAVKAPADGIVLQRFRQSEGVIMSGEPLVEIGDLNRLEIVADVLSTDAVRLAPGSAATAEQWGGDGPFQATVRRVEPAAFTKVSALGIEEQRVNVVLDFDLAPSGEEDSPLGDGYRIDARIVLSKATEVLRIPTSALVRDGRRWAVYVASGGRARLRLLELGAHTGLEAEVRAGLSDGTTVVVHPSDLVHDGVRIVDRTKD